VGGRPGGRIAYPVVDGGGGAVRFRIALPGDRFRWKRAPKPCLYGLSRLARARESGFAVLCEGESDCHVLWFHDVPALGIPGANNWREEWSDHLGSIPIVYIVIEPDRGGEAVKKWLAESRIRDRARLVRLPDGAKDPSALY